MINNLNQSMNYFVPLPQHVELDIPTFKVLERVDKSKILWDQQNIGVDLTKVIHMIKSQEISYMSPEDLI